MISGATRGKGGSDYGVTFWTTSVRMMLSWLVASRGLIETGTKTRLRN
jgi:hypothetical protein